ncbi:MAG: DUF1844 domain-containing protein [Vicinamibacteria bacterium]
MDQDEPNLKVTDRRHFTAEGDLKPESSQPSSDEVPASPAPESPAAEAPPSLASGEMPPVTFGSFIISLATQAAEFLNDEPHDLGAARQVISAIEMLKDKSEGRRTPEESRIMDAILFDLRLAFVGSAKGSKS